MRVAITYYPECAEETYWAEMPAIPNVGDTVFIWGAPASHVRRIYWSEDDGGWFPELHCY